MVVAYNSNFPMQCSLANKGFPYQWDHLDRLYGCAFGAHLLIAQKCHYIMVDVIATKDIIYLREDLANEVAVHDVQVWRHKTEIPIWFPLNNDHIKDVMCDFEVYLQNKSLEMCSGNAVLDQLEELGFDLGSLYTSFNAVGVPQIIFFSFLGIFIFSCLFANFCLS
jgi:hypothetical protein